MLSGVEIHEVTARFGCLAHRTRVEFLRCFCHIFITTVMGRSMDATSKVTSQAQISIPVSIRKALGIGPGATIAWEREGDRIIVRRVGTYSSADIHAALFGVNAMKLAHAKSAAELKAGIASYMRERHARS